MDKLKQRVFDVVSHNKNIEVLQTKMQSLAEEVAQVQPFLESGENDTKNEVTNWFSEASHILKEANGILEDRNHMADKKRLCTTCWDPTRSWETGKMLRGIDKILEKRKVLDLSSYFCEQWYCDKLQSRENTLQEILETLMDIRVNIIGISGMIGVGKTVLAKELARRSQDTQLFEKIVIFQVSESVDVKLMQSQISNIIGLQLLENEDEETRAHRLYSVLEENVMGREPQIESELVQQRKILLILDSIHHVIDLMKVGIPVKGTTRCKVVLLSRNADVCKEMGTEINFSVKCLNVDEAQILFRESLKDKIQSMEITNEIYLHIESVTLMKCGGLPLMINSLTCALRFMRWSNWEMLADKMSRHSLLEVDEVKEAPCAILELCYNFIQRGIKHKLFLLCCLMHDQGQNVPLEALMRYGIAFGLFEDDSFSHIADQINFLVHELKSLSLLSETNPQYVLIHPIIQDVGISALSQGNNVLPVVMDVGTCWHTRDCYENSVVISMIFESNYQCLIDLELHKLQAFVLKDKDNYSQQVSAMKIFDVPENFFQGMHNLKMLEISGTVFVQFPSSIGNLKNLVTLHLEYCGIKCEIMSAITKLDKLQVISLRGSSIRALPEEIGNLTNLRVLDLTQCYFLKIFSVDAVVKLSRLRKLYLYDSYRAWDADDMRKLKSLPLEVLEVILTHQMSFNTMSFQNLRRFVISMGSVKSRIYGFEYYSFYSSVLLINDYSVIQLVESGLRILLPWTEFLRIEGVSGMSNDIADLYGHEFLHLKSIYIGRCQMKRMFDASGDMFPELEYLTLWNLPELTSICSWKHCLTFFPQLRELRLTHLKQLHPYVLPAQFAVKLRAVEVSHCNNLLNIFSNQLKDETDDVDLRIELPYLERLELNYLRRLRALGHPNKRDEHLFLFNRKMKLPSLKELHLCGLDQIENIWDLSGSIDYATGVLQNQPHGISPRFGNLRSMTVSQRNNINSMFPHTIINSLFQLEMLRVYACGGMKEVITSSSDVEDDFTPTTMITFPKLKVLRLEGMSRLQCFYRGRHLLNFPSLVQLVLSNLMEMEAFTLPVPGTQSVLFDGEIEFPFLEHLEVSWMNKVELLERDSETTVFSHLSRLTLRGLPNLKVLPGIHSKTLRHLDIHKIDCREAYMPSMPCELEELRLSEFDSLEGLIDDEKSVHTLFFSLKKLEFRKLRKLRTIPWSMLTRLTSLTICSLRGWASLIPATLLLGGAVLPLLENIQVIDCYSLQTIISQEELKVEDQEMVKYGITLFPSLKEIQLCWLPGLESFSKGSYEAHLPSLETVEILGCDSLQSFSMGRLRTPRLRSVKLGYRNMKPGTFEDLNTTIQAAYNEATEVARREVEEAATEVARRVEATRIGGIGKQESSEIGIGKQESSEIGMDRVGFVPKKTKKIVSLQLAYGERKEH